MRSRSSSRGLVLAAALAACVASPVRAQQVVALVGDGAPDTGGGTFGFFTAPRVNDDGDVVFQAAVNGGTAFAGIFVSVGGGAPIAVVVDGEATPDGGIFTSFSRPSINGSGDIAFNATVSGTTFSSGVFVWSQGQITTFATTLDAVPGSGFFGSFAGNPWIDDDGEVAVRANVVSGATTLGIFLLTASSVQTIYELGGADPDMLGTFANFGDPFLEGAGDVCLTALITLTGGGTVSAIVGTGMATPTTFVLEGDPAPGTGGGTYGSLFNTNPPILDGGRIFFRAPISGVTPDFGVFLVGTQTPGPLVLEDDVLPDTGGGTLSAVSTTGIEASDAREAVYAASISGGTSVAGLFASDESGTRALVLQGDAAPAAVGGTFGGLNFAPSISPAGEIAFVAAVSGGSASNGIFAIPVPEPEVGWVAVLVTLVGLRNVKTSRDRQRV